MRIYEFDAKLMKQKNIDAAYIEFPFDVEKEFGIRGQVKIIARFDGIEYRGSLAKMGHHCHVLGVTGAIRQKLGKQPGDMVHVTLQKDDRPRVVDVPADLAELLHINPDARQFFDSLSFTNRKEYARWITEAKKEETRKTRLEKTLHMLQMKIKHP